MKLFKTVFNKTTLQVVNDDSHRNNFWNVSIHYTYNTVCKLVHFTHLCLLHIFTFSSATKQFINNNNNSNSIICEIHSILGILFNFNVFECPSTKVIAPNEQMNSDLSITHSLTRSLHTSASKQFCPRQNK